ncbi:RHS repeat-associated core domain-containing protein [Amycolatopsis silviterrae]|uniref:RHS repeat-associated core domain-containing protein n=1 Tax=Amycolatopsis silviterrae TaxID=1656914 RepID=A0ABW5HDY9_9PSEU
MSNPLVAEKKDSTSAISGITILEAGKGLKDGIESGDWAATVMGAVGVGMEALAAVMDPFGAILAAGVGWLIEHVGPLKEALDKLAGDPDQVHAYSETWKNVSKEVSSVAQDLAAQVKKDIESWEGGSADAYRKQAEEVAKTLEGAAQACEGAGSGVKTAGEVVGAVRMLVRDIIAQVVAHLISWALQVLFTLGIGMAWVVPQVVNLVAKTAKQIAELVKNLTKALKELGKLLTKARGLFDDVAKSMKGIKSGGKDATHTPKDIKSGGGSTKPSGAKDTPNEKSGGGEKPPPPVKDESTNTSGAHDGPGENKGGGNHEPPPREPVKDEGNGGSGGEAGKTDRGGNESATGPTGGTETSGAKKQSDPEPECKTDPVVISSGEVLIEDFDLELAHLLVRRTHRSSYRSGRWFGPTWASTVDQRLEFGEEYIRYYGPEGVILYYPMPAGDEPVLPIEGARWPLTQHADGSCVIDQVHPERTMRFSGEGKVFPLRSIEDADGSWTELSYADTGAPALLTHSSGVQVGFRTDGHRITELRMIGSGPAPDVVVRGYRYNYQGRLSEVVNSSGTAKRYTYDPDGRVTTWEDRNGVSYRYVYDAEGRCVRTEGAQGFYNGAFEYHPAARVTRFTDSLGHVSEYEYNLEGRPVRETDPLGNVTLSEWDRYGNLLRRVDPLGRVTEYTYADDGTPLTITRPDGSLAELEHDGTELAAITVHGNGRSWQRRYDQPGSALEVPEFFASEPETDDPAAELDQFGRPRSAPEAGGGRTQLGWTVDGKPASRIGVRRERAMWRYDREGNEIEHVDELGRVTRREYGPFDVVTAVVDPSGARTSYTYDTELRLTSVTDPLHRTWTYTYDPLGRLVAQTDFDGRTRTYSYDAAGQPIRVTEPDGSVTENGYDLLGNRIEVRGPHRTVRYAYDPVGNVVRVESADSVVEFDRDLYGRVVREAIDGVEVRFSYDERGQTIRRRTPSGAESVWTFDEEDRPVSLTTAGHTVRYRLDDEGRVLARDTDGTSTLQQAFGPRGLVTAQQVSRGTTPVQRRGLEYYADGSLAAVQDSVAGKTAFTRDPAGRVVTVSSPAGGEELRYNPAGELTAWSGSPGLSADYDSLGRRIRHREVHPGGVRVWEYAWTGDLLTGLRTPDGAQWRYRYDPLGRRIAKERLLADGSVAESTRFVWDGFVLIEQEHTDPAGVRRTTTWERRPGSDEPVTQLERGPGGDRFASVVTDAIGTPTDLIDEHGGLAWTARRSLWGRVQPGGIPLQFPGQYADAESGLHYNVFRYYDPAAARYLSQDPLGLEGGPNPVAYVPDPFAAYDPLGLEGCGKGKGKATDPPPADSTAKHNAGNGGGSSKSAAADGGKGKNKRKRDDGDDGSSGSDGKSSAKKKKDPDVWDRMAWNSDAKNARKNQTGDKNDPFHKAGSDVAQRHIISFQKMRDGLKNWVHEQPVEKQSALTKKYGEDELPKLHNEPKNLPLGPQHTNAGIGGVSTRIGNIEDGIAGKLKVGKNDKITTENPKWPSDSLDKSGGYKHKDHPELDKNWRPIGQQADRITDPKEMNRATRDIGDSADFDWPGGTKDEFEKWHKSFNDFTDLKENPKNYTEKDVDDMIKRFHDLPSPSGRHPTIDEYNKAPDGHPYRFDDKGKPVDVDTDPHPDWKRPDKPLDGNQMRTEWGNRNEQGIGPTKKDWDDLENGKYDPKEWNDPDKKKYLDEVGEPSKQDVKDAAAEAKAKSDKMAEDARKNRGW